jgi:AraC-like DNA-binding protein
MTRDTYSVNPGWALLLTDMGLQPGNVLRRAGLPGDLFSRETPRLTPEQYYGMWRALEAEVSGAYLPVLVARSLSIEAFDPPLFAATCSRDLNAAAERIARYKPLICPMKLLVEQTATATTLRCVWPHAAPPPPVLVATELLFWVALVRLATRHEIRPLRAVTPEPPAEMEPYAAYLGVPIERGADHAVVFSADDAARPFLTANEGMWSYFEPELRRRLSELEVGAALTDRVKAALLELLPAGEGTMDGVARKLAVSTRTLQRKLRVEATTFGVLLAEVRESLARHYLSTSRMPAAEISFLLGYGDPNSFFRAFHAWTGQTPETVRALAMH